jgi:hypothetical protein
MVIESGENDGGAGPQKVVGSVPNLTGFSSRTMVLGPTQPTTEQSTRNLSEGKGWPVCKADNLNAMCQAVV